MESPDLFEEPRSKPVGGYNVPAPSPAHTAGLDKEAGGQRLGTGNRPASGEDAVITADVRKIVGEVSVQNHILKTGEANGNDMAETLLPDGPEAQHYSPAPLHLDSSPRAQVGEVFMAPLGSIVIAPGNPWGADAADNEAFRRILTIASNPRELEPLLVVRSGNGWSVVGDPAGLVAIGRVHEGNPALTSMELPLREVTGTKAAIVLHTARQALGGRSFKDMRRARLSLALCETEGLNGKAIAAQLGLHTSGTTRDIKAARMEREHPVLSQILTCPSDAPVSYYTEIRNYAEMQPSPDKAMATIVASAGKLAKAGLLFTPSAAKVALTISKAKDSVGTSKRTSIKTSKSFEGAFLEQTRDGAVRLTVSFPTSAVSDDKRIALLESWLASASPLDLAPG